MRKQKTPLKYLLISCPKIPLKFASDSTFEYNFSTNTANRKYSKVVFIFDTNISVYKHEKDFEISFSLKMQNDEQKTNTLANTCTALSSKGNGNDFGLTIYFHTTVKEKK